LILLPLNQHGKAGDDQVRLVGARETARQQDKPVGDYAVGVGLPAFTVHTRGAGWSINFHESSGQATAARDD
jgi:hypothetical protein